MNRPIVRLYGLVVLLFALLVAFTSRWTIFEASSLRNNALNRRSVLEQQHIDRGPIVAADGTVLARSLRRAEGVYERSYPTGSLFANTIGYYFTNLGSTGVEHFRSSALNGQTDTGLQAILDQLQGHRPRGQKVVTSLDPKAQRVAVQALGEHQGAVVALEPRTGAVTVMASSPSFNPNQLKTNAGYERLARDSSAPLINRATQFGYAPGSTFKVVTATAAIDSGKFTPAIRRLGTQPSRDLGSAAAERRKREPRRNHADRGAREVGEHGVGPGRGESRPGHDDPLHEPLRLRPPAAARLPGGRNVGQRLLRRQPARLAAEPQSRPRPHVDRPGQTCGGPAADGRGRGGGRRRRDPDDAAPRQPHRQLRRPDGDDASSRASSPSS